MRREQVELQQEIRGLRNRLGEVVKEGEAVVEEGEGAIRAKSSEVRVLQSHAGRFIH
jgi:hypothetical protein